MVKYSILEVLITGNTEITGKFWQIMTYIKLIGQK